MAGHSGDVHESVQAFDEHGEGLLFLGPDFEWNSEAHETKTPYLKAEDAFKLVQFALKNSLQNASASIPRCHSQIVADWTQMRRGPESVFVSNKVSRHDLVAMERQDSVRLITASKYPPLRGTRFTVGELDFLYTTGFVAELGQFHAMHGPLPLLVADHLLVRTLRERRLQ